MPGLSALFNSSNVPRDGNFHRLAEQPHDARIVRRTEKRAARGNQFLAVAENLDVNPFVERDRLVRFLFLDGDADALRHAADVDVVHVLQIARGQKPAQNRARHRVNVRQLPRIAAVSDVQAVGARGRKLREQFAQRLAQRQIRLHLLISFRVEIRQIHRVADFAGEQIARDDFGHFDAAFFLRLVRCSRRDAASKSNSPACDTDGRRAAAQPQKHPAPRRPLCRIRARQSNRLREMISPRAQFTIFTPGFILANAAAFSISFVSFVTGMWTVMKSASR